MLKFLKYSFSVLLSTGLLISCGDKDKNEPIPTPSQVTPISGVWYASSQVDTIWDANGNIVGDPKTQTFKRGEAVIKFTPPSSFMTYGTIADTYSGTYQIKQDSLILSYSNMPQFDYFRYKIDTLTPSRLVFERTTKNPQNGGKSVSTYTNVR